MASSGMLRRVALARTDVSEEFSVSFTRVTRMLVAGAGHISGTQAIVKARTWNPLLSNGCEEVTADINVCV
jgi:hypothetical protein